MGRKEMNIESVICQSLDYACTCVWDSPKQKELAIRVLQRMRPDWSDLVALSAVDWVLMSDRLPSLRPRLVN